MKISILFGCVLGLLISCAHAQNSTVDQTVEIGKNAPDKLLGAWILQIENLQHQIITTMNIHFSANQADSCLGGKWKKIVVNSHNTSDKKFFPIDQPLSYDLNKNKLIIGRNEICDAYLHLSGELIDSKASGEYVKFGWGSKQLGYFSLTRGGK